MAGNRSLADVIQNESFQLRSVFYLITPNESSFEKEETVPNYGDAAFPSLTILFILEIIVLLLQGKPLGRVNDGISSASSGMMSIFPNLLARNVELVVYTWVYDNFNIISLPWDSSWTWFLCFIGVDFGYYWFHRAAHEVNIFWATHQMHHSSEDYNLTTALRQSVIQVYCSWPFYPLLALFIPPGVFLPHLQLKTLYQYWIHTETIKTLGPLEWIFNTPSHHRVHHGRNPYCIDKNYGATLIIWDRIFGTFTKEREEERVIYGLVHPLSSWDAIYAQLCHFQYISETVYATEGIGNKLSVILKGPGWAPGKPRLGLPEDIPEVDPNYSKYSKCLPRWLNIYMVIHFIITILGYQLIVAFKKVDKTESGYIIICCAVTFMVITYISFGALLEHKTYSGLLEWSRCLIFLVVWTRFAGKPCPSENPEHFYIYLYYIFSVVIWSALNAKKYLYVKSKHE